VSTLRQAAAGYLALRRGTGYKYYREGLLIGQFVDFLEEAGAEHVTVETALQWAARPAGADPGWHAARLTAVRGLAAYLAASDSRHQVPPAGLLPRRSDRVTPGSRTNMRTATNRNSAWLFSGRRAGHPMRPDYLARLLNEIGIPTAAGRASAIRQHVLETPAPVVADALGYSQGTTTRLAAQAGGTFSRYALGDHMRQTAGKGDS
jgi:hypothetical protein